MDNIFDIRNNPLDGWIITEGLIMAEAIRRAALRCCKPRPQELAVWRDENVLDWIPMFIHLLHHLSVQSDDLLTNDLSGL